MAKPTTEQLTLPTFALPVVSVTKDSDNIDVKDASLSDIHHNNASGLIVYFYPRDNTPGCTTQATDFTKLKAEFLELGYHIIGVSRDSVESHKKFIEKQQLHIPLISDSEEKLCQHFDVIKEKNMYGKKTMGLVRSTFVFNKDGQLTHAQRNLRAKGYAERLLEILKDVTS